MTGRDNNWDGPYILWMEVGGGEGWMPVSFDTIQKALEYNKWTSNWTIQKPVEYYVVEDA